MPIEIPTDSRMNICIIRASLEHAKLSGQINQRIAILKLGKSSLQDLAETISDLSQQLNDWWDNLPDFIKDDLHSPSRVLPPNVHFHHVAYQHYAYYGSLVAIHSVLVHPWSLNALKIAPHQKNEFTSMKAASMEVYVNATRKFIHGLPQLDITTLTPKWCVLHSSAHIDCFLLLLQKILICQKARLRYATSCIDQSFHLCSAVPALSVSRLRY